LKILYIFYVFELFENKCVTQRERSENTKREKEKKDYFLYF